MRQLLEQHPEIRQELEATPTSKVSPEESPTDEDARNLLLQLLELQLLWAWVVHLFVWRRLWGGSRRPAPWSI